MGVLNLIFFLLFGKISTTIGSDQDSVASLMQEVLELKDSILSIPIAMQTANEEARLYISDKMAENLEALRKEFQALLSNQSLREEQLENGVAQVNRNLKNQSFLIEKLSLQLEDVQSCAEEPPSQQNGRPVDFERKHGSDVRYRCDLNFVQTENSTVRCHFGKWEGQPPVCIRLATPDASFTVRAVLDKDDWTVSNVSCCCEENDQNIGFSRALDKGSGPLPTGAKTYSLGKVAVLDLSSVQRDDRPGAYKCWHERDGKRKEITFVVHRFGAIVRSRVAKIGDTVQLRYASSDGSSYRWLHDGEHVSAWDGRAEVEIAGVGREHAGFYERYEEGDRRGTQWFFKLVLRGCPVDQNCKTCHNGGVYSEKLGTCVCSPGFEGEQCQVVCGQNRFGPNCSESCEGGDCERQLFCRPDPYGCSCAPGYRGYGCTYKCMEGKFGADCKLSCHCASGICDPYTGACSAGCSEGWTGQSCQIPAAAGY